MSKDIKLSMLILLTIIGLVSAIGYHKLQVYHSNNVKIHNDLLENDCTKIGSYFDSYDEYDNKNIYLCSKTLKIIITDQ